MFIALFIIAKWWKQLKCLSIDKWINKMEYHSALKRRKVLIHTVA